jgi:neutrophil cytosolic factor 2
MTEFYDSYIDDYAGPTTPAPPVPAIPSSAAPPQSADRVADWARNNANTPARAPSSFGGSMRSGVKRRPTRRAAQSVYEEEEEGYVTGSGEWEEFELTKIRIKVCLTIYTAQRQF